MASRSGMLYVLYTSWNHYSGTGGAEGLLVLGTAYDPTLAVEVPTLARGDFGTTAANYAPGDIQADGYNRLFRVGPTGAVARLDPATGAVLGVDAIPGYGASSPYVTSMVMKQDVYAFDIRSTNATVYRYNLESKTTTAVAQLSGNLAAATASPCSP